MTDTMPLAAEIPEEIPHHIVDVRIVTDETASSPVPDHAAFYTIQLAGTETTFSPLCSRSLKRSRVYVRCVPGAAGNITGYVLIGTREQVMQGIGFRILNGHDFSYYGQPELYCKGDGTNSLYLAVIDERFHQ
jgi:hypothetical protein